MKKAIALLLASLTLLGILCSCGDTQTETEETTAASKTVETVEETTVVAETTEADALAGVNWGGRTCKILGLYSSYEPSFEIDVEEQTGDAMNDAVFKRNAYIEETYGVEIEQVGDSATYSKFSVDVTSGEADYDIVFLYRNDMGSAILKNQLKDITQSQYIDFTHSCYSENTIESMKINGKLYHMTSAFSLVDKRRMSTIFLNRELATSLGLPDIISQVKDGSWTVDKFLEYVTAASADLNGDSVRDYKNDQFGVTAGSDETLVALWSGMGCKTVVQNDAGEFTFEYASDRAVAASEELKKIFTDSTLYYISKDADGWSGARDAFLAGRALFFNNVLATISTIASETNFAYSAIPSPKYNADQENYYSISNNTYSASFGIPDTAADKDFSGFMIEALSRESVETTLATYYELNCKSKQSYDAQCAEMVDLIINSLTYDFGLMYGSALSANGVNVQNNVVNALTNKNLSLTKFYTQFKKAQDKAIASLLESLNS